MAASTATRPPGPTHTLTPTGTPTATRTPTTTRTPNATPTGTPPTRTATTTPCALRFSDVRATDYFYTPVQYLACRGGVSGYGDGTFRPYANTTRGQIAKIVVGAFAFPIATPLTPTFAGVPSTQVFYSYIETAAARGLVSGYADHTFRPYANVTRSQLAKIIVTAAGCP